ncbi:MAG: hypothetical protein AAB444_01880 [Patescibacteria group bacterium]
MQVEHLKRYFFILGRNPELSLAELFSVFPSARWQDEVCSGGVLLLESETNPAPFMKRLGGTVKIGEVIGQWESGARDAIETHIVEAMSQTGESEEGKRYFGLSAYRVASSMKILSVQDLRHLGISIKKQLQEAGVRSRLVTSKEAALSSVIVKTNHLLNRGAEFCIFFDQEKTFLGKTLDVQEFGDASARDFGRPVHEMSVGMLPVQLAKILINLSATPLGAVLFDPFCGFGTVLAEAAMMGYTRLIGSDLEQKMAEATRKNFDWLASRYQLTAASRGLKLFISPAETISKQVTAHSVDVIVTEPYLGPVNQGRGQVAGVIRDLVKLYTKAFQEFAKILKPGGKVVFVFPAFKQSDKLDKTSEGVLSQIKKVGFQSIPLLPQGSTPRYSLPATHSIIYSRPSQKVLREIFVFQFNDTETDAIQPHNRPVLDKKVKS